VPFRLGYRPALDGVRGLAILTVMVVHTGAPFVSGGFLSVDLFFVLSGFLITSVLLEEWEKRTTIRLGNFYVRRALRLLPGLAALLVVLGLLSLRFSPHEAAELWREIAYTFFYAANWALAFDRMPAMGALGHAWTLAIEEQFYLAWPVLVLTMLRSGLTRRGLALATGAAIAAAAAHRLLLWHGGATMDRLFYGFDTRCDALLAGCLAGIVAGWPGRETSATAATVLGVAAPLAGLAFGAFVLVADQNQGAMYAGGFTVVALSAAVLLLHVVDHPSSLLARVLATRPLIYVGKISYGLYLWHWPAFLFVLLVMQPRGWSAGAINTMRFVAAFAMAELSTRLVEQPALKLKKRWS
jgi:peptidoglycan/LPS O-acetylase OafA/YrhL